MNTAKEASRLERLLTPFDAKRMIYRSLPSGAPGLLGIGSYPKIHDERFYHTPYYKEDEYSGVYLLRGSGEYRDESGFRTSLQAGDFFHRLPGVRHWSVPDPGCRWLEVFLVLPAPIWQAWTLGLPHGLDAATFRPGRIGLQPELLDEFRLLLGTLQDTQELPDVLLRMQSLLLQVWQAGRREGGQAPGLIERACRLLRYDLARELELEGVADELGLGYESFRRWFRQETGRSPGAFRNQSRLEKACELLQGNELGLAEIAARLGYRDAFALSRQFKKAFGLSPSAFRHNSPGR